NGQLMTHEVLSLVHQERGKVSHPWTLYTSLETHHEQGDGCVLCSRLHKHGPGWSTVLHSEVYTHGRAVATGVNVEISNDYAGARNGSGKTGVDLSKEKFGVGVNAGGNAIRVSEGTCIELEETGRVRIRYKAGRIEFLSGDRCVGHIDVNGDDHAL